MSELNRIADDLKRRRGDIDKALDDTSTSQSTTAELLEKLSSLRSRQEKTSHVFPNRDQRKR
jgi:hypothetical protein